MQFLRVILLALAAACAAFPVASQAVESFVIEDIQLEGLRRISPGAVFVALPVRVGDRMNEERSGELIRALFATGFFNDIDLRRDGNVLVIELDERPSIASINFAGNESVKSEDLLEGLRQIDLAPGRVFVPSALDGVEQELQRQYFSQGRYGVQIETTFTLGVRAEEVEIVLNVGGKRHSTLLSTLLASPSSRIHAMFAPMLLLLGKQSQLLWAWPVRGQSSAT